MMCYKLFRPNDYLKRVQFSVEADVMLSLHGFFSTSLNKSNILGLLFYFLFCYFHQRLQTF